MSTGQHLLDVGLLIAVFVGIIGWMISLSTKSRAERRQEASSRNTARQPWGEDKADGRGNR